MPLKTELLLIPTHNLDDNNAKMLTALINAQVIPKGCLNCTNATWSDAHEVRCNVYNNTPPHWAVAIGCQEFDFIPF